MLSPLQSEFVFLVPTLFTPTQPTHYTPSHTPTYTAHPLHTLTPTHSHSPPSPYDMCEMTLSGHAFLMHQVRCMAGILFLIGNGLETPDIVQHMLDIEK